MEQANKKELTLNNNSATTTTTTNHSERSNKSIVSDDDDIWGEEEYRVDGQKDSKSYDQFVASLNYDRMRETFVTLGIKDGVSEGLDEARQVYFEKGLVGGIREGLICGFIIQLLCLEGLLDEEKKNKMKTESALWKKEKMNRLVEMIQHGTCSSLESNEQEEADEDLQMIGKAIEKYAKQVEMFRSTYGSILRY